MDTGQQGTFSFSTAGKAAIASSVIGILAICCLMAFLIIREKSMDAALVLERLHDVGVSLQFILLIPAGYGLRELLLRHSGNMSGLFLNFGTGALAFTALVLLLGIFRLASDALYTLGEGVFGVWLIIVNWRMKGLISKPLRWFGIIVGVGLLFVGLFCVGYAIFVSTLIIKIPAASTEDIQKVPTDTLANLIVHQFIYIGSVLGVLTLPFWTLLLGRRLLSKKNSWSVS